MRKRSQIECWGREIYVAPAPIERHSELQKCVPAVAVGQAGGEDFPSIARSEATPQAHRPSPAAGAQERRKGGDGEYKLHTNFIACSENMAMPYLQSSAAGVCTYVFIQRVVIDYPLSDSDLWTTASDPTCPDYLGGAVLSAGREWLCIASSTGEIVSVSDAKHKSLRGRKCRWRQV